MEFFDQHMNVKLKPSQKKKANNLNLLVSAILE